MISYTKEEIIPSTAIARNFGDILNKLSKHSLAKVAVMRNNKIEAVILPLESFESLTMNSELAEQFEIYKIIKEREQTSATIDFETVLSESGLSLDDL